MNERLPGKRHRWLVVALAIGPVLLLFLGVWFTCWSIKHGGAGAPPLPSLPLPAKEPEIVLTPKEAADVEAQLRGMSLEVLTGGFQIEKITKSGADYVIHCRGKDSILECRVRRISDKDRQK